MTPKERLEKVDVADPTIANLYLVLSSLSFQSSVCHSPGRSRKEERLEKVDAAHLG